MLEGYYPWRAALPAAWDPRPGPPFGDVPMLVYPFLAFVRERLLDGQLPLWTASLNGGQPFLAAYQAAVFSPLTWTALLVPLPHATVAIALLRLLVGGVGLFVFVRGLGLSRGAAFVAGTAYLLNPFSVIWLEHPPGGVPPWLPWMLHAATRAAEGRRFGPARPGTGHRAGAARRPPAHRALLRRASERPGPSPPPRRPRIAGCACGGWRRSSPRSPSAPPSPRSRSCRSSSICS